MRYNLKGPARGVLFALLLLAVAAVGVEAQTANTGTILGVVTDPSGAVVSGADIELKDAATGDIRTTMTNESGRYTFVAVKPGTYSITASAQGFQKSVVSSLVVEVSKSYTINFTLKIGQITEQYVVVATPGAELQTLDATVGDTLGGDLLMLLPSLERNVTNLLLYQPSAMPQQGADQSSRYGGQVAGAQSDQNTFVLDGGNITSSVSGNSDYWTNFRGAPEGAIPTPVESIQEFRVATTNQVASFSGSGGSLVMLVTKRGSDVYHGSAYEYLQNDNLDANLWERNRLRTRKPETKDSRFGASLGGPIPWLRDKWKTYFFFHYEGRRRRDTSQITRLVPTDTLKQGILRFRDASGNIVSYDLATSRQCGSKGDSLCDPRGLGMNPLVRQVWSKFMPAGNDPTRGDGLNTIGFSAPGTFPNNDDFAVIRLDHALTQKWEFTGSARYFKQRHDVDRQVDIGGFLPGNQKGVPTSTAVIPRLPRYLVLGLTGRLSPYITNEFNFSYLRDYWRWQTASVIPQVPGTTGALRITADDMGPINTGIGQARQREWRAHHWSWSDNLSWIKATHLVQFGGSIRRNAVQFWRDDAQAALVRPIYELRAGGGVNITSAHRPPTCSSSVTTNCLPSAQITAWNNLYAAVLGLADRGTLVGTRDGTLRANPIGAPLATDSHYNEYSIYANDSWKVLPSLTLNFGLNWSPEIPQVEVEGKLALAFDASGKVVNPGEYLSQRKRVALEGKVFNPTVMWKPINFTDRKYPYDPTWRNFGPRIAVAWNPSFQDGWLGRLFGDRKTVIRSGYARLYDRLNGVQKVIDPQQVLGFTQTLLCLGPSVSGQCLGSAGVDPVTVFRPGIDGSTIPLPPFDVKAAIPLIPGVTGFPGANQGYALASTQLAPNFRPGVNNSFNLTIQRELPGSSILELGYIHRTAQHLLAGAQLNQVPFFMKYGGQSFAEAFDNLADQIRSGASITPQPFFESALAGSSFCAPPNTSCTAGVVAKFSGNFRTSRVYDLFNGVQNSFVFGPVTAAATQISDFLFFTDLGRSSYNAGFVSYKIREYKGLSLNANFTYGHSLDNGVVNQDIDAFVSNSYDFDYGWGNSVFDRKFVFNLLSLYNLPFGKGGSGLAKIIEGWSIAPIFSWYSGLPLRVVVGSGQEFGQSGVATGAILMQKNTFGNNPHSGVNGNPATGVATAGNAATGGSGLNLFADPDAVFKAFRPIRLSQDTTASSYHLRGQSRWNVDMTVARKIRIKESVSLTFMAQFFNFFNHVQFNDPTLNLQAPQTFGVITSQLNSPRRIELGLHLNF